MKISAIQTIPIVLPKQDPTWRIAYGAFPKSCGLLLKVHTDSGYTGCGYTTSDPPYKTILPSFVEAVTNRLITCVKGQDPFNLEKILGDMDLVSLSDLPANESDIEWAIIAAKSAIDIALYDIMAKSLNIPVYQLLGGLVRQEVPVIRIIAIKEPGEMAKNALRLCQEGYKYIKIKLEGHRTKDIERVKAVRQAVGPEIHLTVDANQSYSAREAIEAVEDMQPYRIELVEQPVPEHDFEGLLAVSRAARGTASLVEAHETVETPDKVFRLAKSDFTGFMNVSLALGGFRALKTAVDVCKLARIKCMVTTIGTRLVSAASLHFVASCSSLDYACQLGEFCRFTNDPASGLEVENGMLRVPQGPGLGIQVNV